MGAIRLIKSFFEALGEVFDNAPRRSKDISFESSDSLGHSDRFQDQPEWFWDEVLGQKIEDREKVTEMMIDDYESRHEQDVRGDEGNMEARNAEAEFMSTYFDHHYFGSDEVSDTGVDSDSGGSERSGYDGYIG